MLLQIVRRSRAAVERTNVDPTILPPIAMLLILGGIYLSFEPSAFSRSQLGITTTEVLPLVLVALGQTVVIISSGIDLSVGGVMSVGSAIAARHFGGSARDILLWSVVILLVGLACGCVNGAIIDRLDLQPFLVTLATWSILGGVALFVLPTQGEGSVSPSFGNLAYETPAGVPLPVWVVAFTFVVWLWFKRTRAARGIFAVGSDRGNAFVGGVSLFRTSVLVYGVSGLCAAAASLAYTMQTASGDPTAGNPFILTSVAAVVIGGTRLSGGRGGFGGSAVGAVLLVLIADVVFASGLPTEWTQFFQGALLVAAILASSGGDFIVRRRAAAA